MTKRDKRETKIRNNPTQVRFDDLDSVMQGEDFDCEEGDGSHKVYRHSLYKGIVTVSPHGGMVKSYQVKQALAALDAVRTSREESEDGDKEDRDNTGS